MAGGWEERRKAFCFFLLLCYLIPDEELTVLTTLAICITLIRDVTNAFFFFTEPINVSLFWSPARLDVRRSLECGLLSRAAAGNRALALAKKKNYI